VETITASRSLRLKELHNQSKLRNCLSVCCNPEDEKSKIILPAKFYLNGPCLVIIFPMQKNCDCTPPAC
jgi:hypothetical protein